MNVETEELEEVIHHAADKMNLQPTPAFVEKCLQVFQKIILMSRPIVTVL
jgi:hypothetical protein